MHGTQRGERGVLQVQTGEPEKIGDRGDGAGAGRPVRAFGQRLDRNWAVSGDLMPDRAPPPGAAGGGGLPVAAAKRRDPAVDRKLGL